MGKRGWVIYNELLHYLTHLDIFWRTKTDFNQPENLEYDPLFGGKEISLSGIFLNMNWRAPCRGPNHAASQGSSRITLSKIFKPAQRETTHKWYNINHPIIQITNGIKKRNRAGNDQTRDIFYAKAIRFYHDINLLARFDASVISIQPMGYLRTL